MEQVSLRFLDHQDGIAWESKGVVDFVHKLSNALYIPIPPTIGKS